MFGRVRIYNLGFAVFSVFSVLLALTWLHGSAAAWWIIAGRILQGVGGAMLLANSQRAAHRRVPHQPARGWPSG